MKIIGADIISQTVGTTTSFLGYDGHGSTRTLTDALGAVTNTFHFDGYGMELGWGRDTDVEYNQVNKPATDMLYSGEQYDTPLQMQSLRARYYDQNVGGFNRLDDFSGNMSDPQSLHKYAYTHNDPVNGIDPSGNMSFTVTELYVVAAVIVILMIGLITYGVRRHHFGKPRKVQVTISVDPTDKPDSFKCAEVERMLIDQLNEKVFYGLREGQSVSLTIVEEAAPTQALGWTGFPKKTYFTRLKWQKGDKLGMAYSENNGTTIAVDKIKQGLTSAGTDANSQLWVNILAHESFWLNAGDNVDNVIADEYEISSNSAHSTNPFTVSPGSREELISNFQLREK